MIHKFNGRSAQNQNVQMSDLIRSQERDLCEESCILLQILKDFQIVSGRIFIKIFIIFYQWNLLSSYLE